MEYRYAKNCNYEDFASGRVLYNINRVPNFPVRLINEIYGRCLEYSYKKKDICLYDCCCGGGYSLTVLGLLNQNSISKIIASDIDYDMLEVAKLNLSLLSKEGISRRTGEVNSLYEQFNKESHMNAMESAKKLSNLIQIDIDTHIFQANAFEDIQMDIKPDIIITDVPYGNLVDWQGGEDEASLLLQSLMKVCNNETIIAVIMNKNQKISCETFKRLEKQNIGKRRFEIYKLK